jgi:hypothetical protein
MLTGSAFILRCGVCQAAEEGGCATGIVWVGGADYTMTPNLNIGANQKMEDAAASQAMAAGSPIDLIG